jgi:hypothetical protein
MTTVPFNHVGILVENLEGAIEEFSTRLGVPFTEPRWAESEHFRHDEGGHDGPIRVHVAHSRVGPPYYELIEVQDEALYSRDQGFGLHHVGVWEDDCEGKVKELTDRGMEVEATYFDPEQRIRVAYFKPSGLTDVRLEIMNASGRASLEQWIHGN